MWTGAPGVCPQPSVLAADVAAASAFNPTCNRLGTLNHLFTTVAPSVTFKAIAKS